jgi:hypothetical protein
MIDATTRDELAGTDPVTAGPAVSLSWSAIWVGIATALGLLSLLLLFGTALGLSIVDPYQITRQETSSALPAATIVWVALSALASAFVGAWLANYLARHDRDESLLSGVVIWAMSLLFCAAGLLAFTDFLPRPAVAGDGSAALSYSSLNDEQFANLVLDRARTWTPGNPEDPINVSADNRKRVDPDDVADNDELHRFVKTNTSLSDQQTEEFLESEKNTIANAQAEAQKRWERAHAIELARADRARKNASAVAWTLTAVAFLSLVTALAGSWLGWWQRGGVADQNADYRRSGSPLAPETQPFVPGPSENRPPEA